MPRITPNLWFDTEGEEAAEFYVSVFPNSKINNISHFTEAGPRPAGTVLTVDFELDGQEYTAINGGPEFTFDEAISLLINCADQAEVDYYWDRLTEGGEEGPCGWLKDRYGVSWQVNPGGDGRADEGPGPGAGAARYGGHVRHEEDRPRRDDGRRGPDPVGVRLPRHHQAPSGRSRSRLRSW
jgi:predicted 3-demethylubiquinone-9 3-methyltransferase (glyoxalase superfamily)